MSHEYEGPTPADFYKNAFEEVDGENSRLRAALARIRAIVGTSTEAWHIANDAIENVNTL